MKKTVKCWAVMSDNGRRLHSYYQPEESSLIKNVYAVYRDKKQAERVGGKVVAVTLSYTLNRREKGARR